MDKGISIVFMGTPDFAVSSLKAIKEAGICIKGVITAPDKPAGRGKKIQTSAVKKYAIENNIEPVLQPTNLKDPEFNEELKKLGADLFVVVAFRMLPESVWSMPKSGTINLHASLLPNYRGAAPINWAVINGDKKTGVTTFFIEKEIDTGKIIRQETVPIEPEENAGSLHDKLMEVGAKVLVDTINCIDQGYYEAVSQDVLIKKELKNAPKIFKDDCKIDWNKPVSEVYNLIRGLSPYPAAWTEIKGEEAKPINLKIFEASVENAVPEEAPGTLLFEEGPSFKISCTDGYIKILSLQQAGKKRMEAESFLRGFQEAEKYSSAT